MKRKQNVSGNYIGDLCDYGSDPLIFNIDLMTKANPFYRVALWTGEYMQLTLMSIKVGGDIGLEQHNNLDQFIRVESGMALVKMGEAPDKLTYTAKINEDFAVIIPAGTWHNIINIGTTPLDLYSIYAPPQHPYGTIHETKEIAEAEEH